jgi:hypothetical protein
MHLSPREAPSLLPRFLLEDCVVAAVGTNGAWAG